MSEETTVEVLNGDPATPDELEVVVPRQDRSTYMEAIEFGKVAAMSNLFPAARDAARAAMVCAMGAALGIPFPVALAKIHILEKDSRITFIIEGSVLAGLINERPGIEYKVVTTTPTECEIEFLRDGEKVGPNIVWDQDKAVRANLWSKKGPWQSYPDVMLRWRALAEGTRIYFPEVISGGAVYVQEEMDDQRSLEEAVVGPQKPPKLTDEEAESIRALIGEEWDRLHALNPDRMTRGRMRSAMDRFGSSHVELRQMLAQMVELADTEKLLQDAVAELREVQPDEKVVKDTIASAERRGSPQEMVDVVQKAVAAAKEKGEDDAPAE